MAYDYQIRPALTQSGYNDADIAYDPNRKAVTLKGKDFLSGDKLMNVSGSNFTDRGSFDTALRSYQQLELADQAAVQNKQRIDALTNQVSNPQMATNPYTSQLDQQIRSLMDMAKTQQNVDPYSTPQYAAYQAQSGRRANEGIRAAQESLGSSGFGRSTALGERAQGIQNQETQYLETQIIPQLIAAEEARRQQQFGNLQSLLNPVQGQQSFFANQAQTERGNARDALSMLLGEDQRKIDNTRNAANDAATFTGDYTSPETKAIQDKMAANSAAYGNATPEEQTRLHAENITLGQQIGLTDTTGSGDYSGNTSTRTLAGRAADEQSKIVHQQLTSGQIDQETAQFRLDQLKDPESPVNKAAAIDLELKQLDLQYAGPEAQARLDQIRKTTAQIGAAPYRSEMDRKLDQVRLDTATEELNQLKNPKGKSDDLTKELEGLYTGLSSGQITPYAANAEIDGRVKMGLTTPDEAAKMKTFIQNYAEQGQPVTKETGMKLQVSDNNDLTSLSDSELADAWETDPTGKQAGRAKYDWRSWVKDSRGYKAGLSYELWHNQYGPKYGQ